MPDNPAAVPGAAQAQKKAAALKARLAKILSASGVKAVDAEDGPSHFTFGVERLDQALAGSCRGSDGLPSAALHELHAAEKGRSHQHSGDGAAAGASGAEMQ